MNLLPSARCETLRTETTGVTSVAASAASRPKVTAKRLINPSYVEELRKRNTQKAEFVFGKKKPQPNQPFHTCFSSRPPRQPTTTSTFPPCQCGAQFKADDPAQLQQRRNCEIRDQRRQN